MTYYRLKALKSQYGWFEFNYDKMLKAIGRKTYSSFVSKNLSLKEVWGDFEARIDPPDGEFSVDTPPDLSLWGSKPVLILNQRAFDALESVLKNYGEFLAAPCDGLPYWLFNCHTPKPADPITSKAVIEDEMQVGLESLNFSEDSIAGAPLFKTDFDLFTSLYCDEGFKQLVESNHLKGLEFRTDLATDPLQ